MIINHNISALNTHRQLGANNNAVSKSLEKLSSGLRINRAGDDAAGLAISEKMRGQIKGLEMASKNAQDGISLIQTAEGALNETHAILQRMRELAVQSSNDTNTDADRAELQKEVDQLAQELSRISNDTEFNTQNLAGGNFKGTFHIGANTGQSIELSIGAMDAFSLGVARDTFNGTINAAATGIGAASFDSITGDAIKDGAEITVTYNAPSATDEKAKVTSQGITFEAVNAGSAGNDISIEFVDPGSNGASLGISVNGSVITVNLATDGSGDITSDADAIVAAINGDTDAQKLVSASGTGSTALTEETLNLTGGATKGEASVKLSDGSGNDQIVSVNTEDSSVVVKDGLYKGLSFSLAEGKDFTNISASDDTITVGTAKATKATFAADGQMTKANVKAGIDISTQPDADKAITTIQKAIDTVSAERSKLGAYQNRLEHTINNLGTSAENLTAAESRIRDVDMAAEMMEFTKNNILTQAAQAMLAQAQQTPQGVLQLLR